MCNSGLTWQKYWRNDDDDAMYQSSATIGVVNASIPTAMYASQNLLDCVLQITTDSARHTESLYQSTILGKGLGSHRTAASLI